MQRAQDIWRQNRWSYGKVSWPGNWQAIKKKETLTNLDDTYLVPETCKRLQFQKKSLSGEGLKVKKQKRPRCVITKSAETHDNNFSDGC